MEFGFLGAKISGELSNVTFTPLDDYDDRLNTLEQYVNQDGYYYPPQVSNYTHDLSDKDPEYIKIPKTERPAFTYHLPPSHKLLIENPIVVESNIFNDEILIIYLLSFIYGTRLQPAKWRFDGRVPISKQNPFSLNHQTCLHFLEHAYNWWKDLSNDTLRHRFINILYVYNRANTLDWEFDAFIHQYMIFDSLFRLDCKLNSNKQPKLTHKGRFSFLCDKYSIFHQPTVDKIYKTRNDLFHEASWLNSTIGFGTLNSESGIQLPRHLSKLNARIITSITGYKNNFTTTPWWVMGNQLFDKYDKS